MATSGDRIRMSGAVYRERGRVLTSRPSTCKMSLPGAASPFRARPRIRISTGRVGAARWY